MITRFKERDSTIVKGKIQMLSHVNRTDRHRATTAANNRRCSEAQKLQLQASVFIDWWLFANHKAWGSVSPHPPTHYGSFVSLQSFQLIMERHLWNRTEFPTDQSLALCGRKALGWSHDNSHTHACIPPQVRESEEVLYLQPQNGRASPWEFHRWCNCCLI